MENTHEQPLAAGHVLGIERYVKRKLVTAFEFLRLVYKLSLSVIRFPYFLWTNPNRFVFHYCKEVVDRTLNLPILYDKRLESIDMSALQKLVQGPMPDIKVSFNSKFGNVNFQEAVAISYIIQCTQPKLLLEIGTFDGFSTVHLAQNSPADATVVTLNLPPDSSFEDYEEAYSLTEYEGDLRTHDMVKERGVGELYRHSPFAHKVTQLYGDSLVYDFSAYHGQVDFCFIDGGHSYKHVSSDTERMMCCLSNRGVIVWHDYNIQHRDIYKFLNKLGQTKKLYHVSDTRLAVYFAPEAKPV
jgi:predicted O-methyltransferase YrrM